MAPPTGMGVDDRVLDLVAEFCSQRGVSNGTRLTPVPNLAEALRILTLKGPDPRWRRINTRGAASDFASAAGGIDGAGVDRLLLGLITADETARLRQALPDCCVTHTATATAHLARFSLLMREARRLGLGWLIAAHGEILAVPRPNVRVAPGAPDLPHDDTGHRAVRWADGSGYHFLRGVRFAAPQYHRIVGQQITLDEIAALPDAPQRSVALGYLSPRSLMSHSGAELLDHGARGTRLYRLALPHRIARDRPADYGQFDYFIHMRDASHPEREFIEWVSPEVGRRADAELCQAHAFGITRQQWLSVQDEG